ncbi:unnamed protein product [Mycena citricolor]|uniref:Uncharacterized protein n=1 Tax=Mycena citricolor TaxID=2018698 RepID=A0AAD2GTD0_9AGAR|nr:unnamed protein product [Mycena citricolor]
MHIVRSQANRMEPSRVSTCRDSSVGCDLGLSEATKGYHIYSHRVCRSFDCALFVLEGNRPLNLLSVTLRRRLTASYARL